MTAQPEEELAAQEKNEKKKKSFSSKVKPFEPVVLDVGGLRLVLNYDDQNFCKFSILCWVKNLFVLAGELKVVVLAPPPCDLFFVRL